MSHAMGQIIKDGEIIAYYEYNGTCDVCLPKLFKTEQEVWDVWRTQDWALCECGGIPTPVLVWTSYGDGGWWKGAACLHCMVLTDGISHDAEDFEYLGMKGHPLGHWNWPWDGEGNWLPEGVEAKDEPRLKKEGSQK